MAETLITIRDSDLAEKSMGVEVDGDGSNAFYHAKRGGPTRVTQEITRPSNATPYSAGDCIADNTKGITTHYLNAGRLNGLGGKIVRADIMTDLVTWNDDIYVVLFDDVPTAFTSDNAAYPGRVYADKAGIIGVIQFKDIVADVTGGAAVESLDCNFCYQCAAGSKKIYFEMYTPGTPTSASGQKFALTLHVDQN